MRLAGANRRTNGGRLEIKYLDTWGTVCDDRFDDKDAQVACDMLGFGYIFYFFVTKFKCEIITTTSAREIMHLFVSSFVSLCVKLLIRSS